MLWSGGQNQKWPTGGPNAYITRAAWQVPDASERETEPELAQKWAQCIYNPFRLGGPRRFRAADKITSGSAVGRVAT